MRRLLVIAALAGCHAAPPQATAADAARANVALAELQEGRALLVRKCGNCHRAPLPTDAWQPRMDEMAQKAKLAPPQRHLIEQYLTAMARR